jgi:hypothetical protein
VKDAWNVAVNYSCLHCTELRNIDSSVDVVTGGTAGVRFPTGGRIFPTASRPALAVTQLPIQWVPGTVSPGVKRPGRETDHSALSSAKVENGGAMLPRLHMSSCA